MKFTCKVSVAAVSPSGASHPAPKPCQSTVGLGYYGPEKKDSKGRVAPQTLFLKICSDKNKTGVRYKATANIRAMFHRFATSQGRATVSLHHPKVDIHFSEAVPGELCRLLSILRLPADKQQQIENLSSIADMSVLKKPVRRLNLTSVADYRSALSDLPAGLERFVAQSLGLLRLDTRVLKLSALTQLDLSTNSFSELPQEWPKSLQALNLSNNQLTSLSKEFCTSSLVTSLSVLDLSGNLLKWIPERLCTFTSLSHLDVSHNNLVLLPQAIGKLPKLLQLHASHNQLKFLPQSLGQLRLNTLSVTDNPFPTALQMSRRGWPPEGKWSGSPSLMELAACVVIKSKIPFERHRLPWILDAYLASAEPCLCGQPTFFRGLRCVKFTAFRSIASGGSYNASGAGEPVETAICSERCYEKYRYHLFPCPTVDID